MQPRVADRVVVSGIDRFVVDVRAITAQTGDFLSEPRLGVLR